MSMHRTDHSVNGSFTLPDTKTDRDTDKMCAGLS